MRAYSISPRPSAPPPRPALKKVDARDMNQHVAHRLRTLRRIRGKTQTDLGVALDLTFQQIAKYERGFSKIAPGTLWRAAEYFEVEIGYFFTGLDRTAPAAEQRSAQTLLRLELVMALDLIADPDLLRSLRELLHACLQNEYAVE